MTEDKNWKILQIIPAQAGWKAVHCEGSANAERKISNRAIVCWALVEAVEERGGQREVRGIEQNVNDLTVVDDVIDMTKSGRMTQIEISISLDTTIRKRTRNQIIGLSQATTGFGQKKKKD